MRQAAIISDNRSCASCPATAHSPCLGTVPTLPAWYHNGMRTTIDKAGRVVIPAAILARRLSWSLWSTALVPFMFLALYYAILNSTVVTLRQGGIRWRDTFYPLDQLRRGNVR